MDRPLSDLIIDIGNTRTKLALFLGSRPSWRATFATADHAAIIAALAERKPDRITVGSVASPDPLLLDRLRSIAPTLVVTGDASSPLRSRYTTPLTLGVDRLANAVAVASLFPGRAALAVDLGTCITYDLVEADGTYVGGAISPGLVMRVRAMHAHSARLPEVELAEDPALWGASTDTSLQSGVHHGILGELKSFIHSATHHSPSCAVVLTGGDALRFARACKSGIFAHPFLTLEGLRIILHHHHSVTGRAGGRS